VVLARMLDVGLIGLGPEWDDRFRPALLNLRHRMRVRVLQSAVVSLADQTAADLQCEAAHGLLSVMERPDVRALLILDTAWYGTVPAEFACRVGKPAFLAGRLTEWIPRAREILPLAAESGTTLMPDFGHRYTPATTRLKELIATRLGRPDAVIVHASVHQGSAPTPIDGPPTAIQDAWLESLDWACHLAGTVPAEVRCSESETDLSTMEVSIGFRRSAAGGAPASARVIVEHSSDAPPAWSAEVRCRKGIARLQGDTRIDWEDASEKRSESLVGERRDVEVMLDHFSRRVVGGLIPVPTLDDLWLAVRLLKAAERSRQSGTAQSFE
jgi:predicted dehydrogenase